jgi:hypothetical protein
MIAIYARLDLTRLNPSEDEMTNRMNQTNRMKQLKRKIHKRELERYLNAETQKSPFLSERRESPASRWSQVKRGLVSFVKTLTASSISVSLVTSFGARPAEIEKGEDKDDPEGGMGMLDLIFIALVIVFFGLSFWYVRFCERV